MVLLSARYEKADRCAEARFFHWATRLPSQGGSVHPLHGVSRAGQRVRHGAPAWGAVMIDPGVNRKFTMANHDGSIQQSLRIHP